jgi:hypothetical protein
MNFAKLIKPGIIPAVPERFRLKGKRTHASTGEERFVVCTAEITADRRALYIVEGGVTGHESFLLEPRNMDTIAEGWCACAGTTDRWDKLEFDAENMTALVAWIRVSLRKVEQPYGYVWFNRHMEHRFTHRIPHPESSEQPIDTPVPVYRR